MTGVIVCSLQYGLDQTWWCPGDVYGLERLSFFNYMAIQYTIINAVYVMPRQDGPFPCELHEWASLHARGKPMRDTNSKRVSFVESEQRPIDELRAAKVSANQRPSHA